LILTSHFQDGGHDVIPRSVCRVYVSSWSIVHLYSLLCVPTACLWIFITGLQPGQSLVMNKHERDSWQ